MSRIIVPPSTEGSLSLVAPGDRPSLHATARGLRDLAGALRRAHATQHDQSRLPVADLGGETGASFRRGADKGAAEFHRYHRVARLGARAFDQLAWDMRHLQHLYDVARSHALQGVGLVSEDGTRLVPPPATAPGQPPPDFSALGLTAADNARAWDQAITPTTSRRTTASRRRRRSSTPSTARPSRPASRSTPVP